MHFGDKYALKYEKCKSEGINYDEKCRNRDMIYILLTDLPNGISRFIKYMGFWKYSHVSVGTSMIEDSSFYSYVGKHGFFKEEPLIHPTFKGKDIRCALFAVPVSKNECRNITNRILNHAAEAKELKYSYLGLILSYFDVYVKFKKQYTCAVFVSEMIRGIDILSERKYKRMCNPEKFRRRMSRHLVYKGTVRHMLTC